MIIKYEMKNNMFLKTPCPYRYDPVKITFNRERQDIMVGSIICQQHCEYFVDHNHYEKYIICSKEK